MGPPFFSCPVALRDEIVALRRLVNRTIRGEVTSCVLTLTRVGVQRYEFNPGRGFVRSGTFPAIQQTVSFEKIRQTGFPAVPGRLPLLLFNRDGFRERPVCISGSESSRKEGVSAS